MHLSMALAEFYLKKNEFGKERPIHYISSVLLKEKFKSYIGGNPHTILCCTQTINRRPDGSVTQSGISSSLEKLLIANSSVSKFNNKEDSHAVTEIQEDTKEYLYVSKDDYNQFPKHLGYDCPFETPESKVVDHDKNNLFITLTLTGSTLDDSSINLPDNLESINGYDPQHKLEFSGLNTLDLRHRKLKEYYIFQDYKSLIAHTIVTQLINL
ncbi:hypothetical protein H8356DRAFT_1339847 [Neocallimastix lanati (nom. inval.)]|nr:hypothetical protein H8356DRAFT_1339847 [Neocallimastix sp. JGI-2020a]